MDPGIIMYIVWITVIFAIWIVFFFIFYHLNKIDKKDTK